MAPKKVETLDLAHESNYMLHPNPENGGDTEFLYPRSKTYSKQGSLVFFPTAYTHPYRGNPCMRVKSIL